MPTTSLNPEQVVAVTHGNGPLLIIAGAGTGKTTVITERITHLILKKKVSPANILALTFTEKAATEMEERLDIILPYGIAHMWIATFHAFCDRILRQEAIHIGLDSSYKLATEAEMVLFLKKNLFKLNLDYFRPLGNPTKFIQGVLQHFSRLQDEDISPNDYILFAEANAYEAEKNIQLSDEEKQAEIDEAKKTLELAHAYQSFEALKIQEGIIDFSNLIGNTLKLFRTRKNILKQYQNQFQYILIDEFQDTNYAQNELGMLLAGERKNITVCADDDQSIYNWRGAAVSNMLQFKKNYTNAKIVALTKNYRSTQNILDASYSLIQFNNPNRLEIQEGINKKLVSLRGISGNDISLQLYERADNEAEGVVKRIIELIKKKKYKYKDFAILVRANDHAKTFIRMLDRMKIPYQFLGPGQLFHQEEIKDLIAYLKVLTNFEDSPSLYRILNMPIFQISGTCIATLLNSAKKKNYSLFTMIGNIDNLSIENQEKEKVQKIHTMITHHLNLLSTISPGQILFYFLQESGYIKQMIDATTLADEKRAQNIALFFEKLKVFETEHADNSIYAAVEWIELSMQMGESPLAANGDWTDTDAINILTVHSSKGLEFPVVFLVNLIKDRFPSRERREQIPVPNKLFKEQLPEGDYHLQEERRLFYVAMTRARDELYFTASKFYGEGKRERKLSPFVSEALGLNEVKKIESRKQSNQTQLSLLDLFVDGNKLDTIVPVKTQGYALSYLSYSQIQTFDMCPLHYKLRYILKIPTAQSSSQSFGTSVHAVLREFYQLHIVKNPISIDEIDYLFKKHWISEGYTSAEHEKIAYQRAITMVKNYLQQDFNPDRLPVALELPFEFYLDNFLIGGRIDRIDVHTDGTVEIIDYKTGSSIPDEKELKKNLQLTTYALATSLIQHELFNKKPGQVLLSLYYLENNIKLTTTRTQEQLEKAKLELISKANEIKTSDFICSASIFCKNCEFKMLCKSN